MQLVSAATTWLRKTWHWLTSMRTALVLLFLLSLASIPVSYTHLTLPTKA